MYGDCGPRKFILGEEKYVDFIIKSSRPSAASVSSATWKLIDTNGDEAASGTCVINGDMVSALVEPEAAGRYTLDVTYVIGDETRVARTGIEVIN